MMSRRHESFILIGTWKNLTLTSARQNQCNRKHIFLHSNAGTAQPEPNRQVNVYFGTFLCFQFPAIRLLWPEDNKLINNAYEQCCHTRDGLKFDIGIGNAKLDNHWSITTKLILVHRFSLFPIQTSRAAFTNYSQEFTRKTLRLPFACGTSSAPGLSTPEVYRCL